MLIHEENVNVLLFELPITDCGGEALKVLGMISLKEECENYTRGFICQITPKSPLIRMTNLLRIPRKGNQSMKKGLVVESPTTPMNGNMGCQSEIPQGPVDLSFLLIEGTG
jgi:hypothetical protein